MPLNRSFVLETLVDFPDDTLSYDFALTRDHLDSLMRLLAANGVGRVVWGYYGDGHGGWMAPGGIDRLVREGAVGDDQNYYGSLLRTYRELGNPLREACAAAHRHGLEVYAYFKPYESGVAMGFPAGSPEALEWGRLGHIGGFFSWIDPFVAKNPHLRIKRRTDDLWPGHDTVPIATIKLTKKDASPTRVTKDRLSLWASERNYGYERLGVDFGFAETVEPSPREVRDVYGNLVTRRGDPVRVLTLSGLNLAAPFVAVATDVNEAPGTPDFENAWDRLAVAYDAQGRELPCVVATGTAIWFPELERFPERGLAFETGRGPEVIALDRPKRGHGGPASSKHNLDPREPVAGVVALGRGKNAYLAGALCETEPAVRDYWLRCVGECLDAGADGVEFRVENHSCHSEEPEAYGFNDAVLAQVPEGGRDLLADITRVRSEAYTGFLRAAKRLIASRGRRMRVNLNIDWFRPPHERPGSRKLAYPANIDFPWRRWVSEGLLDEAMLRPFAKPFAGIFRGEGEDRVAQEMIAACGERGIPLAANRYVWANEGLLDEFKRTLADDRLSGFVLYETWSYTRITPDGVWELAENATPPSPRSSAALWKTRAATAGYVRRVFEHWRGVR